MKAARSITRRSIFCLLQIAISLAIRRRFLSLESGVRWAVITRNLGTSDVRYIRHMMQRLIVRFRLPNVLSPKNLRKTSRNASNAPSCVIADH